MTGTRREWTESARCYGRAIGLGVVVALLAFNFFSIGKYSSYPWWHQHDCDSDPLYVAQAMTLVNDGPFDYIHHPGAVVSSGNGLAYRVAAAIAGWHPEYLEIRASVPGLSAWELLEDATRFSRRLSFIVFAVFIAIFYGFIFWLTRNGVVALVVTFFVATSQVAIWHSRAIRPEVPSLLFSVLALWAVLVLGRNLARGEDRRFGLASFAIGITVSLAMFSKIQILPVVAALLLLGFGLVVASGEARTREETGRWLRASLVLGVIVAAIAPWW
ncbi:MAG: phospholipid carrier-dependent glycosyltransferase, partial [Thermoanaerobaculales bacterium]|nr:phospholipid carrier-dependent glycosyltransferase [Thermoanaerobaculales bacterium]